MFDDLDTSERKTEDEQTPADDESKSSSGLYRWAHFPAILAFGILFLLFRGHPWRWHIAIGGGYTVYVFFFAITAGLKDSDDFFSDSRALGYVATLLIPHVLGLTMLMVAVTCWFSLKPTLPSWVTQEGRKGSFWDLLGWLVLAITCVDQGFWMAGKIKRRFGKPAD
jgi:hypothetical protein